MPVTWLRHVAATLGPESAAVRGALRAAGLSAGVLVDDTDRLPARKLVDFLEHAARLSGDDTLGLRLGKVYDMRASGLPAYVSISSATLREAIDNAIRYIWLNDSAADYALVERGDAVTLRLDSTDAHARSFRQAPEFKLAFIVAACRRWVEARFAPAELRFAHPRGSSLSDFSRYFGCPVLFGSEATEMVLSRVQLELPMRSADPYLLAMLKRHGDALLAARSNRPDSLKSRVEKVVLSRLPKGAPTVDEVAEKLGLGERTLARKLRAEGAPYSRIVEELRRGAALSYLADPGISLAQIAYLLGFSDQSAFTTAFRRWTGQSPRRFREGHRRAAPTPGLA